MKLNLSVNNFGDQLGWNIVEQLRDTKTMLELDLRNSYLSATTTMLIDQLINRNNIYSLEEKE